MRRFWIRCLSTLVAVPALALCAHADFPPEGFRALFNGKDFTGLHGMPHFNLTELKKLTPAEQKEKIEGWNKDLQEHWKIENGELVNDGKGVYVTTDDEFRDYELLVDFKIIKKGDSGVYLKATPQVQIWDYTEESYHKLGADKGSGGLWNNTAGRPGKDPLTLADKPIGEWNTFKVRQLGARTSVWLNDKLVVDNAILENYFDRKAPLFAAGPIQLQTHGNEVRWRNLAVREIGAEEANKLLAGKGNDGFTTLFNGKDLEGWAGETENYEVVDGTIRCKAGKGGNLYTKDEYGDFVARVEFKLPPGGNNGLAIRYPGSGNPAYAGMTELQVLDTDDPKYASLDPRQAHGSAYGMIPAARGYGRPVGEWNFQEVTVQGSKIKVELNGNVILDGDLAEVKEFMANSPHPGKDLKKGHFGFAGHSDPVQFRNVQIKPLEGGL